MWKKISTEWSVKSISSDDRGTILIGSIATLSVCFPNFCGVYDERVVYPNLYLFVTAEAGMGKGALTLCRELITPINRQLHELTKTLDAQYKADMAEYTKSKKSKAIEPPSILQTLKNLPRFIFLTYPWYWIKRMYRSEHFRQFLVICMACAFAVSVFLTIFLAYDNAQLREF